VADWVKEMLAAGIPGFYKVENGGKLAYSPEKKNYISAVTGDPHAFIVMRNFENQTIWKNSAAHLYHLGDEVLGLEWYTKLGTIGGEVLEGIQRSIAIAEEKYKGLVIANEAANFSAGANVGMIFMLAVDQNLRTGHGHPYVSEYHDARVILPFR
jgi:3-hydroxyacyl-CoA dehydrogenase